MGASLLISFVLRRDKKLIWIVGLGTEDRKPIISRGVVFTQRTNIPRSLPSAGFPIRTYLARRAPVCNTSRKDTHSGRALHKVVMAGPWMAASKRGRILHDRYRQGNPITANCSNVAWVSQLTVTLKGVFDALNEARGSKQAGRAPAGISADGRSLQQKERG
jgi:hypothetical protein